MGHYCLARLCHIPVHNMLSCMGLCRASSFLKRLLFTASQTNILHVLLNFINSVYSLCASILCFSLHPLYIFWGWMVVNAVAGFEIKFLYCLPSLCCFFSQFSSLCFLLCLSPFSFLSSKHEINFSSWDRMTLACGVWIWRLMAKLYYTIAPEWQSAVSCQWHYLSDLFMNCVTGVCQHLIWFLLFKRVSMCTQVIDLDQWYCVCLSPFIYTGKPGHTIFSYFPSFSPSPVLFFFSLCLLFPQKGWLCPSE